jgi:hypothetical protein
MFAIVSPLACCPCYAEPTKQLLCHKFHIHTLADKTEYRQNHYATSILANVVKTQRLTKRKNIVAT